ncbi:MAG: hypothetical protein JST46_01040 [Bacteroidetes bacterium]|nr:hypothetical protein [Bacteroidota bacterium]
MKTFFNKTGILLIPFISLFSLVVNAESIWPKELKTEKGGVITIYQPQPESLKGDRLVGRAAFSAKELPGDELQFGVFWYNATLVTDRDTRTATLESITISEVRLPGVTDENKINKLKAFLEKEIPKWEIVASLDDIAATIEQEQEAVNADFKNNAPEIIFKTEPTTLVLIDGEPRLKKDEKLGMNKVINTPFLIVENPDDKKYYLYGGQNWYVSALVAKDYNLAAQLPKRIQSLDKQLKKETEGKAPVTNEKPAVLVSLTSAELIQSKGEPQYVNIQKTSLLYISNSEDDIFKSIEDQKFYVLLSGRWYAASDLKGPWAYISGDQLPKDFANIPEGSEKDNVLASVPGTPASRMAVMDAQIPQTAKVDRKKATCTVTYDGEPKFEKIEGTSLSLAVNTTSKVLQSGNKYYCVETGVWFVADSPKGPWKVSDERPKEVDKIPASSPAYPLQYVYIYDSTPEVVYVGYTPGYTGCYVYGGTVVYGTGYYYNPWYGPYYYPQPVTYGFSMHYNPWTGWSMGFHMSYGWFHMSIYGGGGYWGPPMYRPPYYPPYRGGMYGGRGPTFINNGNINIDRSNNIYNGRNDVATRDRQRGPSASQQPAGDRRSQGNNISQPKASQQPTGRGRNDVYGDRSGNVYQRGDNGDWSQRNGNQWNQADQRNNMNRDYENRQRSSNQNAGFQQMNRGGGGFGGGGARGGGGGRRR